ncbi:MAG: FadR/GntR family transcriptional regulator [Nocardioidaceae bacterium]
MDGSDQLPRRRYLHVAEEVLAGISRGEYAVGSRLPGDRDLAVGAGVSRATAREAILALELIGAVEVRRGDGVYVARRGARLETSDRSPLDAPPRELIEARTQIEPAVVALAAGRVDDRRLEGRGLAAVRELVDATEALVDAEGKLPEFVASGLRFHSVLAPCCGNQLLADMVTQLVDVERHPLWTLVNQQAMRTRDARADQVREHRDVVDAIAAGDPPGASRAMGRHLGRLAERVLVPTSQPAS